MTIEQHWSNYSVVQDDLLNSLIKQPVISKISSHHPLEKIRRSLMLNMIFGVGICMIYVWIIAWFKVWQVQLCMSIVLLFSLWAVYTACLLYTQMKVAVSASNSLLAELKRQAAAIRHWMQMQQRVALLIYPISATGGFLLGGVAGSGKSVQVLMQKPIIWIALLIALLVLVPACYYLARWMFNVSFGKHLQALDQSIEALESEK